MNPEDVDACSEFGQGYCPEVDCGTGTTEPYDEDECTGQYCVCDQESGIWEEEVNLTVAIIL